MTYSIPIVSDSDPNTVYYVTIGTREVLACTCPGWTYRGKCKHADKTNAHLTAEAALYTALAV